MGSVVSNMANPLRRACGIGPITSMESGETKAKIPLVPRIYRRAIIGAEMRIEHAMLRAGSRDSPATVATDSKPDRAPKVILLKTLRLNRVMVGSISGNG